MTLVRSIRTVLSAALAVLALGACSAPQDSSTGVRTTYYPGTSGLGQSCTAGYLYHPTYGCLPQGGCAAGTVLYANQCTPIGNSLSGSCPAGYVSSGMSCVASPTASACQGTCPMNQVQTIYGCLPQNTMKCGSSCYGFYNGYCIGQSGDYYPVGL